MQNNKYKKTLAFTVIVLFLEVGVASSIHINVTFNNQLDKEKIGLDSALKVANAKLIQSGRSDFSIISSLETTDDIGKILFYIFNLQPQGYIVVSADYTLPPVIAYSFTSNFKSDEPENVLLQILIADISLRLENIQSVSEDIIEHRILKWEMLLNNKTQNYANPVFQQWPSEELTLSEGWLETNWHQNPPYNNFCPIDLSSGKRSIAGCPAVAMAQILNYHQTTKNIAFNDSDDYKHKWSGNDFWIDNDHALYDFPSFPELNDHLDTLVSHYQNQITLSDDEKAALVFACGVAAEQVYHPDGSGTFGVNQAYQAYARFGFDDIKLLTEDDYDLYDCLISNMMNGLPAHIAVVNEAWTVGHNMVVDGYNTEGYYHINFGWGGTYDGWYLLPTELPFDLTVIEGIIVDITDENVDSDLHSNGVLRWTDVEPSSTITGSFTIENVGSHGSEIDWEIIVWPSWGEWTFTPSSGDDLKPENGPITIQVSIVAPNNRKEEFNGHVKVVNIDDSTDSCLIHVFLATPKYKPTNTLLLQLLEKIMQRFPRLLQLPQLPIFNRLPNLQ